MITALEVLAYDPSVAAGTLRLLAARQGRRFDEWLDEQPGKILHELRIGEYARLGEIPQQPYYGTVDATPLFLILLGRHAAWTADLSVFDELRDEVELALEWIDAYGDSDGDGYVDYRSRSRHGLVNQGWKDSGTAIVNADGSLAEPPIALVEVQGYVYQARLAIAELFRRRGEAGRAAELEGAAADLRARFERDFWRPSLGTYALALQAGGRPADVVASNAGHALWAGIAGGDRARATMERLMAPDMFGGWGIRTLSTKERRYNPIGYHLGTVWPHDNALIAVGFRRYGLDDAAGRVFLGLVEAAMALDQYRLPEAFAGFDRARYRLPVRYPVACHPQAWAAGAVPYLLQSLLGLVPEAFEGRLRIVRPALPPFVDRLTLRRLRVGDGGADVHFARTGDGGVEVDVLSCAGGLQVVVDREGELPCG
ncbi:MAG TPA: hypothetical protein VNJ28_06220 [Candidatus Limnocylindrales bacterium]|nr:hypothetical protein [Candidatus Limnocylindrales bacterium]